jgi:hypothetical protein
LTVVTILMFEVAPASSPERVHVTVPLLSEHDQPASGFVLTKVTWLGSGSVMVIVPVAFAVPWLMTAIV